VIRSLKDICEQLVLDAVHNDRIQLDGIVKLYEISERFDLVRRFLRAKLLTGKGDHKQLCPNIISEFELCYTTPNFQTASTRLQKAFNYKTLQSAINHKSNNSIAFV
jgi:hypothetical protein